MRKLLILAALIFPLSGNAGQWDGLNTIGCNFTANVLAEPIHNNLAPKIGKEQFEFIIDNIDLKAGKARLIGNLGGQDVVAIPGLDILSFIQVTDSGNVMSTSIFIEQNAEGNYLSVHSRNMHAANIPMPSQYYGTCHKMP